MKVHFISDIFCHISPLVAFRLKLTNLQVLIINAYIQNFIAGTMRPYLEDDKKNTMWLFPINSIAALWGIGHSTVRKALSGLTTIRVSKKEKEVTKIQLMRLVQTARGTYLGMDEAIIFQFIRDCPHMYAEQCLYHKRCDLLFGLMKEGLVPDSKKQKVVALLEASTNYSIISDEDDDQMTKPLIDDVNLWLNGPSKWSLDCVDSIIKEARKKDVRNEETKKKVFNHNLDKPTALINRACNYLDEIYAGTFFEKYKPTLKEDIKKGDRIYRNAFIDLDEMKKIVRGLAGDKEGIIRFFRRCARFYFMANQDRRGTFKGIKRAWPLAIDQWIYQDNPFPFYNFMLYYNMPDDIGDKKKDSVVMALEKKYGVSLIDWIEINLCPYRTVQHQRNRALFWLYIKRLLIFIGDERKKQQHTYDTKSVLEDYKEWLKEKGWFLYPKHFDVEGTSWKLFYNDYRKVY